MIKPKNDMLTHKIQRKSHIYIPYKDIYGNPIDKALRVEIGGDIHKKIIDMTNSTDMKNVFLVDVQNKEEKEGYFEINIEKK